MRSVHSLKSVDYDAVVSQKVMLPRFNGQRWIVHCMYFIRFYIYFISDLSDIESIEIFVNPINQEGSEFLRIVLVAIVELLRKGCNGDLDLLGRNGDVLTAPYGLEETGVGFGDSPPAPQWIGFVHVFCELFRVLLENVFSERNCVYQALENAVHVTAISNVDESH